MSPRQCVPGLVVLALALSGCGGGGRQAEVQPTPPPTPAPKAAVVQAAIAGLSEREGVVLAELPLGAADGIEPGTLLRVYADAADGTTLKGMLQVTEVLPERRCIARQIGLNDRANPLKVGDQAQVADLGATLAGLREDVASGERGRTAADQAEDQRYAALRENYRRELALAQARADQRLAEAEQTHQKALAEHQAAAQRALQAKELERQTDLAGLRAATADEVAQAVARDRTERDQKLKEAQAENRRLSVEIDRLATEVQSTQQALAAARKELAARDARYRDAVRAEVETREALTVRLAEVERRLAGSAGVSPVAVLSNDPQRGETVLARLERVTAALAEAQAAREKAEQDAAGLRERISADAATTADLTARAERLTAAEERAAALAGDLERARGTAAQAELGRLEAERALYDLASRVLRLTATDADVKALQTRLQGLLTDHAAAPAPAPEGAQP